MSPAIVSATPRCICIMYDSMFSHSSSVVTVYRWRCGACSRNDACPTGVSWGCQRRQRESVQQACHCWLSRDVFNVSDCQVAICHALSSHSIILPGSPDGITYDKADTLPGTAESLELWDDPWTNLKRRFHAEIKISLCFCSYFTAVVCEPAPCVGFKSSQSHSNSAGIPVSLQLLNAASLNRCPLSCRGRR